MPGELMTVDELIRVLAKYPPHLRVVVNGYECGYDDLTAEQVVRVEDSFEHWQEQVGGKAWGWGWSDEFWGQKRGSSEGCGIGASVALRGRVSGNWGDWLGMLPLSEDVCVSFNGIISPSAICVILRSKCITSHLSAGI